MIMVNGQSMPTMVVSSWPMWCASKGTMITVTVTMTNQQLIINRPTRQLVKNHQVELSVAMIDQCSLPWSMVIQVRKNLQPRNIAKGAECQGEGAARFELSASRHLFSWGFLNQWCHLNHPKCSFACWENVVVSGFPYYWRDPAISGFILVSTNSFTERTCRCPVWLSGIEIGHH